MSRLSYMSNQPMSASGASAIASSFDWKKRGSTQSGRRLSMSGRTRPERTVTVLVIGWRSRVSGGGEGPPDHYGQKGQSGKVGERNGAERRGRSGLPIEPQEGEHADRGGDAGGTARAGVERRPDAEGEDDKEQSRAVVEQQEGRALGLGGVEARQHRRADEGERRGEVDEREEEPGDAVEHGGSVALTGV